MKVFEEPFLEIEDFSEEEDILLYSELSGEDPWGDDVWD